LCYCYYYPLLLLLLLLLCPIPLGHLLLLLEILPGLLGEGGPQPSGRVPLGMLVPLPLGPRVRRPWHCLLLQLQFPFSFFFLFFFQTTRLKRLPSGQRTKKRKERPDQENHEQSGQPEASKWLETHSRL